MNWIIWGCIMLIVLAVGWMFFDAKFRKGTKVRIRWSKFIDDREINWAVDKKLFGYNKYNKALGVEEFHLPKLMRSPHPIAGLNPDDMEVTNGKYPLVHIVQVGETIFIPKKREDILLEIESKVFKADPHAKKRVVMDEHHAGDTDVPKKQFFSSAREYLADKDVQGWATMQSKYNAELHAEKKKGFDKYAPLIIPAIAMMVALIIIVFAINKAGDITSAANGEIKETTSRLGSLVDNFINNQNENNNVVETDAAKPPAAQGTGEPATS